ncbi:MAG: aspartyl protease family protein [Verrucomicrobia bacterium]|nr:aspartyl protease family protein [Verrucomicrobiota bacterium]
MIGALFRARAIGAALVGVLCAGCQIREPRPAFASAVSVPLSCQKNKLLVRATAPGGIAKLMLDTGAPITCADKSKQTLFQFAPLAEGLPTSIVLNNQREKAALIPQLEFGGATVNHCAVALVDFSSLRTQGKAWDGILGLCELRRLHAVIDCGAHTLSMHSGPVSSPLPAGWHSVPIQLIDNHLVVPVFTRGIPTLFIVDTGAPFSIIDTALCSSQRIPVKEQYHFTLTAIHYQTKAGQLGVIPNLRIGSVRIGKTPVAICDMPKIMGPRLHASGVTGLLGTYTLERLNAIIDCHAMQFYFREP